MKETTYTWVSLCHDCKTSFLDEHNPEYATPEACYNAMRDSVLSKMTWNTVYKEDFETDDAVISYQVYFRRDMIIHRSFSGDYIYLIVDADNIPTPAYVYGRMAEFLGVKAYEHHYGI